MSVIILEHFPLYLSTLSVHKEWSSCLENPSSLPILLATSKTTSLLSYCLQPAAHVLRGKWQQLAVFEYFLNTHSKLFTHHYRGHFFGRTYCMLKIAFPKLISRNFCYILLDRQCGNLNNFTWNQFWLILEGQKLPFWPFWMLIFGNFIYESIKDFQIFKIQNCQNGQNGSFWTSKWPKLILRKIWVAVKSWKFHTEC